MEVKGCIHAVSVLTFLVLLSTKSNELQTKATFKRPHSHTEALTKYLLISPQSALTSSPCVPYTVRYVAHYAVTQPAHPDRLQGVVELKLEKTSVERGRFVEKSQISLCEFCGKPHRKNGLHPYLATKKPPKNSNDCHLSAQASTQPFVY